MRSHEGRTELAKEAQAWFHSCLARTTATPDRICWSILNDDGGVNCEVQKATELVRNRFELREVMRNQSDLLLRSVFIDVLLHGGNCPFADSFHTCQFSFFQCACQGRQTVDAMILVQHSGGFGTQTRNLCQLQH